MTTGNDRLVDFDVSFDNAQRMNVQFESAEFNCDFGHGIILPDYSGAYTVTPTSEAQTLPTAGKTLGSNIVVNPIPSNYGLITWDGSTLSVT